MKTIAKNRATPRNNKKRWVCVCVRERERERGSGLGVLSEKKKRDRHGCDKERGAAWGKGHNSHFPPTQFLPESPSQETGRPFSSSDYTAWNIITASFLLLLLLLLFWQRREKMMMMMMNDEDEDDWNIKKSSAPHAFREKRGVTDFWEISTPLSLPLRAEPHWGPLGCFLDLIYICPLASLFGHLPSLPLV